jgi:DNA-binding HxlR family transcriptional regulator
MKRQSLGESRCPIARTLDVIGDWWSLMLVRDCFMGKRRFGEFEKSLGLAKNILSARLQKLTEHGILELAPASDGTAYQEYRLTEKGDSLCVLLVALQQWGEDNLLENKDLHLRLIDRKTGKPLKRLELRSQSGRPVEAKDLVPVRAGEG